MKRLIGYTIMMLLVIAVPNLYADDIIIKNNSNGYVDVTIVWWGFCGKDRRRNVAPGTSRAVALGACDVAKVEIDVFSDPFTLIETPGRPGRFVPNPRAPAISHREWIYKIAIGIDVIEYTIAPEYTITEFCPTR